MAVSLYQKWLIFVDFVVLLANKGGSLWLLLIKS